MKQEIEKIGDEIYKCLGVVQNELSNKIENKAYITDALSKALYKAGYRLPEQKKIHNSVTGNDYPVKEKTHGAGIKGLWADKEQTDKETIHKAVAEEIAKFLEGKPTDGWDKWHFYNKELAAIIRNKFVGTHSGKDIKSGLYEVG